MRAAEALDRLAGVLFPKTCYHCGAVVAYEQLTCGACAPDAPQPPLCPRCGHPERFCNCGTVDWAFARAAYALYYRGHAKDAALRLKERPDPRVCAFFAQEMERAARAQFAGLRFDFVTEVPASREKLAARGYNHAELIARAVSARMTLHHSPRVLAQSDGARSQHELDGRKARFENASRAFSIARAETARGKRILLVDNLMTTGATAHFCALALKQAGAREVGVLTACGSAWRQNIQKTLD